MKNVNDYLPSQINRGPFLTAYSLPELQRRVANEKVVLPICSLGTPCEQLAELAPLVLPPLYHEALDDDLKSSLLKRIRQCFPYYQGTQKRATFGGEFEIVELLPVTPVANTKSPRVLALSVDTAVEEHGPHLPLATDTIQSYSVLRRLAEEVDGFVLGPPVEYGQLTWGLPFGLSIDITAPLLTRYVAKYIDALLEWLAPEAIYVVDVHGSIVHRTAIIDGLKQSRCKRFAFRWLHEPLVEFAGERGDQHAGGVETALVELIDPQLVDLALWPSRIEEIAAGQMGMQEAIGLSADLSQFVERVEACDYNGIVGDVLNYNNLDAELMMQRMLDVAREDVAGLLG